MITFGLPPLVLIDNFVWPRIFPRISKPVPELCKVLPNFGVGGICVVDGRVLDPSPKCSLAFLTFSNDSLSNPNFNISIPSCVCPPFGVPDLWADFGLKDCCEEWDCPDFWLSFSWSDG